MSEKQDPVIWLESGPGQGALHAVLKTWHASIKISWYVVEIWRHGIYLYPQGLMVSSSCNRGRAVHMIYTDKCQYCDTVFFPVVINYFSWKKCTACSWQHACDICCHTCIGAWRLIWQDMFVSPMPAHVSACLCALWFVSASIPAERKSMSHWEQIVYAQGSRLTTLMVPSALQSPNQPHLHPITHV